jgi:hypothetical protein
LRLGNWFYVGRTNYAPNGTDIRIGQWVLTTTIRFHIEKRFPQGK